MSTRSTVLYTEKEHWFTDSTPEVVDGEMVPDVLTVHIDKSNVVLFQEDEDSYVLDIKPGTDLYKQLVNKLRRP